MQPIPTQNKGKNDSSKKITSEQELQDLGNGNSKANNSKRQSRTNENHPSSINGPQQINMRQASRPNNQSQLRHDNLVYPSLNIVCSPRIFQQKIRTDRVSLTRYKERVYASGCRKSYEEPLVPIGNLAKFVEEDGMIYNIRDMRVNKNSEAGGAPIGSIKVLICICMYNQSMHAIQLTLQGIYENLKHFEAEGISSGDIAVVLIQDGILKLVSDRKEREYVNGEDSMVEFYRKMDQKQGKAKCDLEERINIILDEMDNYERKGMSDFVSRNNDFPPSIEKNASLLYQNMWSPSKTKFDKKQDDENKGEENKIKKKYRRHKKDIKQPMSKERKIQIQREKEKQRQRPANQQKQLRLFSCFKHINGTKLSSHLWFFEGFCRYIEPTFCVLLDVGTKPSQFGLLNLIKGFDNDRNIGGVTGFMSVDSKFESQEGDANNNKKKKGWIQDNFYSVEKAQEYEYIISHFYDKNAESSLGFLHVLPGAWSAYRYKALIKSDGYEPNLLQRSYFKMILNPNLQEKDYMEANMYLAEDRILSLGIYCQLDSKYILKYVPDAVAHTDPMKSHQTLMNQRRRWINSSLFAFLYVFRNYYYNVMESKHNFFRKYILLNISMFMALLSFVNTYFTPCLYFFILYSTIAQLGGYGSVWEHIAKTVSFIYVVTFLVAIGGGLTGRPWTQRAQIISYILSAFTFLLLIVVIYNILFVYLRIADGSLNTEQFIVMALIIMLFINVGSSLLTIAMHLCTHTYFVWRLIADSMSYLAYTGAYSQVMVAHSFCNVDDVSWGTKGSVGAHGKKKYQAQKVFFVSSWLFYNMLLSAIFIYIDIVVPARTSTGGGSVLIGIAIYGSAFLLVKTILAVWYHVKWILFHKCCDKIQVDTQRKAIVDKYWEQHERRWSRICMEDRISSKIRFR